MTFGGKYQLTIKGGPPMEGKVRDLLAYHFVQRDMSMGPNGTYIFKTDQPLKEEVKEGILKITSQEPEDITNQGPVLLSDKSPALTNVTS